MLTRVDVTDGIRPKSGPRTRYETCLCYACYTFCNTSEIGHTVSPSISKPQQQQQPHQSGLIASAVNLSVGRMQSVSEQASAVAGYRFVTQACTHHCRCCGCGWCRYCCCCCCDCHSVPRTSTFRGAISRRENVFVPFLISLLTFFLVAKQRDYDDWSTECLLTSCWLKTIPDNDGEQEISWTHKCMCHFLALKTLTHTIYCTYTICSVVQYWINCIVNTYFTVNVVLKSN